MWHKNRGLKIVAVNVFLEKRKSMVQVGTLTREKGGYKFAYKRSYLYAKGSIPVGNELPTTQSDYFSATLFPSFYDRIPSKENPSYPDYCRSVGISETETDALVLLSTIGRRGPSSFIFEPVYDRGFDGNMCKKFRLELGLTIREFAGLFDISTATLRAIEQKKGPGKEALKRLEIYYKYPDAALEEMLIRGRFLHESKRVKAMQILRSKKL